MVLHTHALSIDLRFYLLRGMVLHTHALSIDLRFYL